MEFWRKIFDTLTGRGDSYDYDNEDYYDDDYDYEDEQVIMEPIGRSVPQAKQKYQKPARSNDKYYKDSNVIPMPNHNNYADRQNQVVISCPKKVDDGQSICSNLKNGIICVVDLTGVEPVTAQRIADFLAGVTYTLNGDIQRISHDIFLAVPRSVDITSEVKKELKDSGIALPWIQTAFR